MSCSSYYPLLSTAAVSRFSISCGPSRIIHSRQGKYSIVSVACAMFKGPSTMPSALCNSVDERASSIMLIALLFLAQGLRTYLLAYGAFYHSLSQEQLCEMFDMSDKEVWEAQITHLLA